MNVRKFVSDHITQLHAGRVTCTEVASWLCEAITEKPEIQELVLEELQSDDDDVTFVHRILNTLLDQDSTT